MIEWPAGLRVEPIGAWPGVPTGRREQSPFRVGVRETMATLRRELAQLEGRDVALQVAIPPAQFRLDGRPRADARATHPGVILTMQTKHGALSYPCDAFTTWEDNLRAIALALEALRKVDRYRVTKRGEQYRGSLAIEPPREAGPAPIRLPSEAWNLLASVVAGGPRTIPAPDDRAGALSLLRSAQRKAHPDQGGDVVTVQRVYQAEEVLRAAGLL